ncbi:uncharacterized protein L3040_008158 [Drepanopeziza brunnea f. sp. 'multigermtubi']|uniref:Uncharacterized protein n=1 Tax=Marssonina brunnea f. sp. multigermtubi (strain MB_m1) TaxID=1072389 RepID=K1XM88_MARBU|nr:uncharacterized protein MBM_08297 [Drepanopeziza brunnea f. sp. 'multigermtubi' MB_m1]EKD13579.1 hypothetical protein MBM_08297 [Drepanopeziza brunnea f. sp. 'multigermtubi' MB_m1]KAJ5034890.1 hypothetical protein L3040_008158 [Drepanopeziza brunnea f. sp. 'multigermtubi']
MASTTAAPLKILRTAHNTAATPLAHLNITALLSPASTEPLNALRARHSLLPLQPTHSLHLFDGFTPRHLGACAAAAARHAAALKPFRLRVAEPFRGEGSCGERYMGFQLRDADPGPGNGKELRRLREELGREMRWEVGRWIAGTAGGGVGLGKGREGWNWLEKERAREWMWWNGRKKFRCSFAVYVAPGRAGGGGARAGEDGEGEKEEQGILEREREQREERVWRELVDSYEMGKMGEVVVEGWSVSLGFPHEVRHDPGWVRPAYSFKDAKFGQGLEKEKE